MTISISAQNDQILEDAVNSGLFRDKQEAISAAIFLLGKIAGEENENALAASDWKERFHRHIANTPETSATFVDDSRESIYEGRGL